ncbi:MAG TPA: glutamine--fructose-6-phosphate transaminase (isomerizing), partial [Acidimicrobiales bacterium]|nr:glutamine--fructose-6-phosphate transaminase (isomerizing) [Acidimicrobiales bacterium]
MCGIVGYVGGQSAVPVLLEGLRRLEYRGYDSAGLATVTDRGVRVHKASGRVRDLEARLPRRLGGHTGIAHTRWATHGAPSDANAHPHVDGSGRIAVVHNGIIENGAELRAKLAADGVHLASETDSEVLAHLIARSDASSLEGAVRAALGEVAGTYGLAVVDASRPDQIVAARNGSPVVLGIGERETFVASDVAALVRFTRQVVHLEDGELAVVSRDGYRTATLDEQVTTRSPTTVDVEAAHYERDGHPDFMHKEIHEQPVTLDRALRGRIDDRFASVVLGGVTLEPRQLRRIRRVTLLGCGSAYYAGELGALLIEQLARIPADAQPAGELGQRNAVVDPDTLYLAISQSGETHDTLVAVDGLLRRGAQVLGVVNVVGSALARACGSGVYVHAGPEVSVTSTKTFTNTVAVLALLGVHLGRVRDLSPADGRRLLDGLRRLPPQVEEVLAMEDQIAALAARLAEASSLLYVGRGRCWPVAREGAQKLKEVSYLHAEAYPASELKHGPLALVSPAVPTVALLPNDELVSHNLATVAEIRTRGGPVLALTTADLDPTQV